MSTVAASQFEQHTETHNEWLARVGAAKDMVIMAAQHDRETGKATPLLEATLVILDTVNTEEPKS